MNLISWRHYLKTYGRYYRTLTICSLASTGQAFILLPIALLIRRAFDEAIPARNFYLLALLGTAIFLATLASEWVGVVIRYRILVITKLVTQQLRHELIEKVFTLPRVYYGGVEAGPLHASIVQDTERLDVASSAFIALFLPALLVSVVLACILAFLNWLLFLIVIAIVPALLVFHRAMNTSFRRQVKLFHESFERFSKSVLFLVQMIDLTKIQAAERFETDRQRARVEDLHERSLAMVRRLNIYVAGQNTLIVVTGVMVLIVGGWVISMGRMTVGELLSFYVALALLGNQLKTVSSTIPVIIVGHESLSTLSGFLALSEAEQYSGGRKIKFKGQITLESVSFSYPEKPVLRDVSMSRLPHSLTAITGASGAGKSTLASLMLGLYRPQRGQLYADGQPFDELDLAHLRASIGVVPQEPVIFFGTVLENITYGRPRVSREEVSAAAKIAMAHDFIERLPNGYNTVVGEKGILLSGGQRQRLAIARALLRQPALLILDEPTNHLEDDTILLLMENLQNTAERPATLIISHQQAVISAAHQVFTITDGLVTLDDFASRPEPAIPYSSIPVDSSIFSEQS